MDAKLKILHAGPSVSIQDQGRPGHLRYGVTESGAMDRTSYAIANAVLDNPETNPAIEISLGGVSMECVEGSVSVAIVGGHFTSMLNDEVLPAWVMLSLSTGDTLKIRPGEWGSWCYLAFAANLKATPWLDSYAIHLKSGICGTALAQDDVISLTDTRNTIKAITSLAKPNVLQPEPTIRAVVGPQDRFFESTTLDNFLSSTFTISAEYDRMGMRLSGCNLPVAAALDMPSEPILRGSLQVPGHGDPICLMADHHTAGGYPKIATVISADIDALSQHRSGHHITFEAVSVQQAVQSARDYHNNVRHITSQILLNRVGMTQRLWRSNLISGASSGDDEST